jgi:Zn-dependent protease
VHFDPAFFVLFPVFVLSIVVHECAHGLVALWCGDTTARDRGRLTLNPLPHVDPVGSILLPAILFLTHSPFLFGWAKPVPIEWANLRHPRNDQLKVALAGPVSNALLAIGFAALARVAPAHGFFAPLGLAGLYGVFINCALGLFNLLPIPPLDGSWVLMRFLRLRDIILLQQFRMVGILLVVLLLSVPRVSSVVLGVPLHAAVSGCLGLFGLQTPQGL